MLQTVLCAKYGLYIIYCVWILCACVVVQTQAIRICRITAQAFIWSTSYLPNESIFLLTALGGLPENPGNFWTRNARKLIKGSKDSDSSLVSNKNFSEIVWPSSWALGPVTWAKMAQWLFHLWRRSQKIRNLNQKNFFKCRLEDWPIRLSTWTAL